MGKGDFDALIKPRSDKDILGHSLISMKKNLQKLDSEHKKQVWAKTQVANVTQSIQGIRNLQELLQTVTEELAEVLQVGYGAFYLLVSDDKKNKEPCLFYKLVMLT